MTQYTNDNCRICLKLTEEQIALEKVPEGYSKDYLYILKDVVPSLEISYDDGLPKQLCITCANEVIVAYKLRKKALSSEKILQNMIQKNSEVKVQINDIESLDAAVSPGIGVCGNTCDQCSVSDCSYNVAINNKINPIKPEHTCRFCGSEQQSCNFCSLDEDKTDICSLEVSSITTQELEAGDDSSSSMKTEEVMKYICSECGKDFATRSRLNKHIMTHTPAKPFHCKHCKWSFATEPELQTHTLVNHNTVGRNECVYCQKTFKEKRLLRQHMITHKQQKRFNCKYCDKGFNLLHHLKNHEKIHENKTDFPCDQCDKKFLTKDRLQSHQKTHEQKKFKCEICDKGFTTNSQLTSHLEVHSSEPNYICSGCGLQFMDKTKFDRHQKLNCSNSHINDNTIMTKAICLVCNFAYDTESILKEHMKLHTNALICPTCNKSFVHVNTLEAHIKTHVPRAYICENCNESFNRMDHLKYHIARKHSDVTDKDEIYRYTCNECGKKFLQSGELTIHMRTHTNTRPYVCDICNKAFNQSNQLRAHERIHSNEKPYVCKVCQQAYHSASGLNQHLKSSHTKIVTVETQISLTLPEIVVEVVNNDQIPIQMDME